MAQEKLDYCLDMLPDDLVSLLFQPLSKKSQNNLALTSKMFGHSVFQNDRIKTKLLQHIKTDNLKMISNLTKIRPDLLPLLTDYLESKKIELFKLAGFGKQEPMKIILKANPDLFYIYEPLKDISNVYPTISKPFCKGITVFQHAIWAGDMRYMCNMMLDCLPANAYGETIRIELLRQYNELMEYGVVYEVSGKLHSEKQFNLNPLIETVQNYVDNFYSRMSGERESYWCTKIGDFKTACQQ